MTQMGDDMDEWMQVRVLNTTLDIYNLKTFSLGVLKYPNISQRVNECVH